MKSCSWCLWLGNEKIFNIRQLRENFDTAVLVGYYLGGGLERWLNDAEETLVLAKVKEIDRSKDIGTQLEFIFGVRPDKKETAAPEYEKIEKSCEYHEVAESVKLALLAASEDYTEVFSSFGSSFSFGSGSGFISSGFKLGFERELRTGSFSVGSFRKGSFRIGSLGRRNFGTGSFRTGSFKSGSFRLVKYSFAFGSGSFSFRGGSFGSGISSGSFTVASGGSYRFFMGNTEITREEYKRTKINLSSCPLNAYGYGIHRI